MKETAIERVQNRNNCIVYTNEQKFVTLLNKYKKDYPNEVKLEDTGEGFIKATVPYKWLKFVAPPRKVNLTDEQKEARSLRMKKLAEEKRRNSKNDK